MKNLKQSFLILASVATLYSCKKAETVQDIQPQTNASTQIADEVMVLNENDLNKAIEEQMKNSQEGLDWNKSPINVVWSAIQHSQDKLLFVGYKPAQVSELEVQKHLLESSGSRTTSWTSEKGALLNLILEEEAKINPSVKQEDILVSEMDELSAIVIRISNPNTLKKMKKSDFLRYAEPTYEPSKHYENQQIATESILPQNFGCGAYSPVTVSFLTPNPNSIAMESWNYGYHRIKGAWASNVTGKGIEVMVLDGGHFDQQQLLTTYINNGLIKGRSFRKQSFISNSVNDPQDNCGHGTALAGVIGAPRMDNGFGFDREQSMMGVAYGCNLYMAKVVNDVVIDTAEEVAAVANAFNTAANSSSVRIISMSLGRIGNVTTIADAIRNAKNRGKLIFVASGTAPWLVSVFSNWNGASSIVFPANMVNETVAVSGIKTNFTRADEAVVGAETDFVVVMQNDNLPAGTAKTPLGMSKSSRPYPSTIGGSSVATATMAGMAALVWSKFPGATANDILYRLRIYSNFGNNRHPQFGWGSCDVSKAIQ
ncbi:hypothetical protein AD998_04320 [bacterium 336/3]|nr:hypothetical protein AD998_04320 [bacterium 336/3]